ncbi:ubiquitin fusion degradation protein 1 homolog [Episyrphus balteatus]|uniref:ubiquitin fusion degradation protein 1 homolog n=1 Tax=Episyrphus balteatus TaxID=286459 RepID=UPI0024862089|nr:ubiquitin fusion degradation protein 1 homolog [Episyrphus balteatus]
MFQFGGFNMIFPDVGRSFQSSYKCFSVSMLPGNERHDVEKGGKIIMPPSALDALTRLNVEYPMLFKLINSKKNRNSHAGVLEFVADEGKVYLPYWMMDNLLLEEGDIITIESVSLPVATFSKFQPHSTDFLDITNPKAVLENALRNFACLTTGDVVAIKYNKKVYELCVLETKPGNAVSIIECDMNVEFEAPVGYKEPGHPKKEEKPEEENVENMEEDVNTFSGSGNRLDGKKKKEAQLSQPVMKKILARGIPDYDYKIGVIKFDRNVKPISDRVQKEEAIASEPEDFQGQGFSMKKSRK